MLILPMIFSHLIKKTSYFVKPTKMIDSMGIHLPMAFKQILERECARADRTGSRFALVRFGTGDCKDRLQLQTRLIQLLKKRIRLTDELGWMEDNHVGLLLFNANTDNATRFVSGLKNNGLNSFSNLIYCIYVYPSDKGVESDRCSGVQQNQKFSRSQGPSPMSHQFSKTETGSQTHQPEESANSQRKAATVEQPVNGSIKSLLLKVPLWKRIIDFVGATTALVIFSPLFLITAFYIKMVSPGPVFFKQDRLGYGGKVFRMWKFRTMHVYVEQGAHRQLLNDLLNHDDRPMKKLADDACMIPLGKFLRKCCIDELPQLINVFRGEMSLVGPRPDPVYAINQYHHWYTARFDAVPGMTGLWQVSGKNQLSFQQMMRLDIAYARQQTVWIDLKILFITIPAIVWNAKYDA